MENNYYYNLITLYIPSLHGERWAPIRGYESRYWISTKGRVCSLVRHIPKILRQQKNNYGYYRVCLSLEKNQAHYYLVHRLVAEAFIYNDYPEEKTTVHHINENKKDNSIENLQHLSLSENIKEHIQRKKNNGKK